MPININMKAVEVMNKSQGLMNLVALLGLWVGASVVLQSNSSETVFTQTGMRMVLTSAPRKTPDVLSVLRQRPDAVNENFREALRTETNSAAVSDSDVVRSSAASLDDDTQPAVASADPDKVLYLTFDDGPVEGTENVLRVLQEEGVAATMFCVGRHAQKRPGIFLKESRMPNLLVANHTYSHANGHYSRFYSDLWGVMSDVEHAQLLLGGRKYLRLAGRNVWRLPEVTRNDGALSAHRRSVETPDYDRLAEEGFYIYGWDVEWRFDHRSGRPLSTAHRLADRIDSIWRHHRSAQRGKIVLLAHDFMFRDRHSTRQLRTFLRIMKERGWSFRTIDHYSRSKPEPLYVAKYYGKPVRTLLASAAKTNTTHRHVTQKSRVLRPSDAYRPGKSHTAKSNSATTVHIVQAARKAAQNAPLGKAGERSIQVRLNDAIRKYEAAMVERLIRQGARINRRDAYGRLALNTAIRANSIVLVKKLLSMGADLQATDAKGYTALVTARAYKRTAIEKYLIEYSLRRSAPSHRQIVAINQKPSRIDPLKMLRQ